MIGGDDSLSLGESRQGRKSRGQRGRGQRRTRPAKRIFSLVVEFFFCFSKTTFFTILQRLSFNLSFQKKTLSPCPPPSLPAPPCARSSPRCVRVERGVWDAPCAGVESEESDFRYLLPFLFGLLLLLCEEKARYLFFVVLGTPHAAASPPSLDSLFRVYGRFALTHRRSRGERGSTGAIGGGASWLKVAFSRFFWA